MYNKFLSFAEIGMVFEKQELSFDKGIYFTEINVAKIGTKILLI